jgi:hypothetical protein
VKKGEERSLLILQFGPVYPKQRRRREDGQRRRGESEQTIVTDAAGDLAVPFVIFAS